MSQASPSMSPKIINRKSMFGSVMSCLTNAKTNRIETTSSRIPGRTVSRKNKGLSQSGIRGAGIVNSLEPHWEHTWAVLGFGWCFGQSFTLYVLPQNWQNSGCPVVTLPQLWQ